MLQLNIGRALVNTGCDAAPKDRETLASQIINGADGDLCQLCETVNNAHRLKLINVAFNMVEVVDFGTVRLQQRASTNQATHNLSFIKSETRGSTPTRTAICGGPGTSNLTLSSTCDVAGKSGAI